MAQTSGTVPTPTPWTFTCSGEWVECRGRVGVLGFSMVLVSGLAHTPFVVLLLVVVVVVVVVAL